MKATGCFIFLFPFFHHLQCKWRLTQKSNMKRKEYDHVPSFLCCLESHCLLSQKQVLVQIQGVTFKPLSSQLQKQHAYFLMALSLAEIPHIENPTLFGQQPTWHAQGAAMCKSKNKRCASSIPCPCAPVRYSIVPLAFTYKM